MKKISLLLALIVPMLIFTGCNGNGDEPDAPGQKPQEATLKISDDVVGLLQNVILRIDYSTNNPNILVTWYLDGEKLNKTPISELELSIVATKLGEHQIKAVVTDGDKIVECSKAITIMECDLARGIIGDSKEKIRRTLKTESNSDVLTGASSNITEQYHFRNNRLYKIYREQNVPKVPQNKMDYTYPYVMFSSLFESYTKRFGNPVEECFTNLDSSEESIVKYGGFIYSGSMRIFAKFKAKDRQAEIEVGSCRSSQVGFNIAEMVEKP